MSKPSVISLFTGAGGLDYGLEAAGFRLALALELDPDACATIRHNRPPWPVVEKSIHKVRSAEVLDMAGARKGNVDLLVGGPPCQSFSKSGLWRNGATAGLRDPRARTLRAFMRLIEECLPRAFLLENVPGFASGQSGEALRHVLALLKGLNRRTRSNYTPVTALLDAAAYGVPQHRERFFIVAVRDGTRFEFPSPTHGPDSGSAEGPVYRPPRPLATAWDAIGHEVPDTAEDLAVSGKWADLLPSIPEGQNYLWHTSRGGGMPLFGWRTRYWSFLLKLSKRLPSWTLQANPGPAAGPFHWKNRRLSIRELCLLQTFPKDVTIIGEPHSCRRQVGNAVPSLLAEVLGRALQEQVFGIGSLPKRPRLLPKRHLDVPRAERTQSVPFTYLKYYGDHAAHPGAGKGPGARDRERLNVSLQA